jgi:HAD superfamily hydrolase (TIGR01509 family)
MSIKAVLFDHDGTIADSEQAHFEMWRDILCEYHIDLTHDEYESQYAGIPTKTNAIKMIENHLLDISPQTLVLAKAKVTNVYLAKQAFPLMAGAFESICYFHQQGLQIGVVTGASRKGVMSTLKHHGLEQYISVVVSGDDVEHSKPAPDCYLLATEKLGLQPAECLAIEDTYSGSLSALRANIPCVGVSTSSNVRELFCQTVHECADLHLATQWIERHYQRQKSAM